MTEVSHKYCVLELAKLLEHGPGATAYDELTAKAAELRKAQPQLSEAQAIAKVYADPVNRNQVQLGLDLLVDLDHLAEMTVGNASY